MSVGGIGTSIPGLMNPTLLRAKTAKSSAASPLTAQSTKNTAASLEGQIRAAREQLNDWVTCVSATTPKGQAEIRSLSAQISSAQERINRLKPAADPAGASVDLWA